jgi:DNA-binding transcriptional MerR regulator
MAGNVTSFDVTLCDVSPATGTLKRVALTIDELARETGLTVRNVRSHHARGLLPPPEVRGRTGYYGQQHINRLRLIQELQQEGLKLDGIRRILAEDDGERLLALKRAGADTPETPEVLTGEELLQRLRIAGDARPLLRKAEKLGMLVPLGDGHFEVPSPALLAAAEQVVSRGVSLDHALDMIAGVERHARAVSKDFIKLFMDDVIKPFADAGMPEEGWEELAESVERVRPLAAQALLAVFRRTMDEEVEATFAEIARRLAKHRR